MSHLTLVDHEGSVAAAGSHRKNSLGANRDVEAYEIVLRKYSVSPNTQARYRYVLQRFATWLTFERQAALNDVTRKDIEAYCHALANTGPFWMARLVGQQRLPPRFKAPLSPSTIESTLIILRKFFSILEKTRYIELNPLALGLTIDANKRTSKQNTGHADIVAFPPGIWRKLLLTVYRRARDAKPGTIDYAFWHRWRFTLVCMYELGLRTSEAIEHGTISIATIKGKKWVRIKGKGNKKRDVPVTRRLIKSIELLRSTFNIDAKINFAFLFGSGKKRNQMHPEARIDRTQAYREFQRILKVADVLTDENGYSLHSIRHTRLTHLAARLDPKLLMKFAGHSRFDTTMKYYHGHLDTLHALIENKRTQMHTELSRA